MHEDCAMRFYAVCLTLNRKDPPWYTYIVRNSMASLCIGTALGLS